MQKHTKRVFRPGTRVPARFPRDFATRKKMPPSFYKGTYRQNPYRQVWHQGRSQGIHRVKWQKKYGMLPKGVILHHKNHDKQDFNLRNLAPMKHNDHAKISGSERPATYEKEYKG